LPTSQFRGFKSDILFLKFSAESGLSAIGLLQRGKFFIADSFRIRYFIISTGNLLIQTVPFFGEQHTLFSVGVFSPFLVLSFRDKLAMRHYKICNFDELGLSSIGFFSQRQRIS
jgi:hypothetical protein